MSALDRFICRFLWWRGHSVGFIAGRLGCTMNDVEKVLFVRVA